MLMDMDIVVKKDYLPTTIEELNAFILIGKQKLIAHKAKIKAIRDTRMAIAAQEAALSDAQDMADILLDAEVRMGEILDSRPAEVVRSSQGGTSKPLPPEITKKQSHQAQTLSKNKSIVEQAKIDARERGEIVTSSKVYQTIKGNGNPEPSKQAGSSGQGIYFAMIAISQLERIHNEDPEKQEALNKVAEWVDSHR
jgi:hypothetical protein